MPGGRPMTAFTVDSKQQAALLKTIQRRSQGSEVAPVAFQAPGHDGAVEMHLSGWKSRADDPFVVPRPIRRGHLIEQIGLPVKVRLSVTSRSNHNVESFRQLALVG